MRAGGTSVPRPPAHPPGVGSLSEGLSVVEWCRSLTRSCTVAHAAQGRRGAVVEGPLSPGPESTAGECGMPPIDRWFIKPFDPGPSVSSGVRAPRPSRGGSLGGGTQHKAQRVPRCDFPGTKVVPALSVRYDPRTDRLGVTKTSRRK